MYFNIENGILD